MKKLNSNRQLKIGALLSYCAIAINIISALIYSPWMLSKIGSGDYGLYTLSTSLISMFLLDFGISSAVSRFTSKYVAEGRQDKVNELLGVVYKLFGGISAIVSIFLIVIYFFADKIYVSLTPLELEHFKVVYIITASFSVISFPFSATLNGILTSYEKFIQMKLCDICNKLLTVLLIVIALLCGYGLYALVAINAAVNLLIHGVKSFVISRTTSIKINFKFWDKALLKEIFGFSVWVIVNSICARLIMNICPNILGITAGTLAITIFGFASTIEGYSYTFSSAIDGMFIPRIAKITYKDGDMSKILPLMIKVGRFQYHLIGLIVVGFSCVGSEFVNLWIGAQYHAVYYCALFLLLPAPFYLSQQIGQNTLVMVNQIRYLAYVNIIKAVLNVIFVSIFSLLWGAIGACASICVVYMIRNVANMYLYKTKLGLDMRQFCRECYGKMSIPMLITLALGLISNRFFYANSWIQLGVKIVILVGIYFIGMWMLGYNTEEKALIKSTLQKLIKKYV